jgi:hypothetical protein
MNADNGKIVGEPFPIAARVGSNIFDPETRLAACSTGDGTIYIFHEDSPDKFSMVQTVKTEFGAKTMALDSKTHNLLADAADFETPARPAAEESAAESQAWNISPADLRTLTASKGGYSRGRFQQAPSLGRRRNCCRHCCCPEHF